MTDADIELLIRRARDGDDRAFDRLWCATRTEVLSYTKGYYIAGTERSDIRAICRVAVWQAAQRYDVTSPVRFGLFASLIAKRSVLTALDASKRRKRLYLEDALLNAQDGSRNPDEDCLLDMTPDPHAVNALERLMVSDEVEELEGRLRQLTPQLTDLERRVFDSVAADPFGSYMDWSAATGFAEKTIDNTLMRIRLKAGNPHRQPRRKPDNSLAPTERMLSAMSLRESGVSYREIAERLGISYHYVSKLVCDARRRLANSAGDGDGRRETL